MRVNFFTNVKTAKPYLNPKKVIVVSFAATAPWLALLFKKIENVVIIKLFAALNEVVPQKDPKHALQYHHEVAF